MNSEMNGPAPAPVAKSRKPSAIHQKARAQAPARVDACTTKPKAHFPLLRTRGGEGQRERRLLLIGSPNLIFSAGAFIPTSGAGTARPPVKNIAVLKAFRI